MARNKNSLKKIKKNKYNIFVLIFIIILLLFISKFFINIFSNIGISKYDNEIIVIKNDGDEIISYTMKDIRSMETETVSLNIKNQTQKTKVEGISFEKILNKLNIDSSVNSKIEFNNKGVKKVLSMDRALEPERIYLIYKINSKPLIEYNESYGNFAVIDNQSKEISDWIVNVNDINIK